MLPLPVCKPSKLSRARAVIQRGRLASGGDSLRSCSGQYRAGPGGRPERAGAAN